MVRNIGLFIGQFHESEDQQKARTHLEDLGLCCYTDPDSLLKEPAEDASPGRDDHEPEENGRPARRNTFVFTDARAVADRLVDAGIGFAVYESPESSTASFPEALYLVDRICALSKTQIDRFLLRHLNLPWPILETKRCILREITEQDVPALYEIYNESDKAFQYTEGLFEDPEEELAYTRNYISMQYRFYEYGIWIVTDRETGRIIGRAGLESREGYEDAELGYAFALSYRHKGYAYEVCSAILDYAYKELGMQSLNAFTLRENKDSVRLLEHLGFRYDSKASLGGVWHDLYRIQLPAINPASDGSPS